MYTATTPKLTFEFEDKNMDLTEAVRVWLTVRDKDKNLLLKKTMTVEAAKKASVILSQEETLALPIGTHDGQINYLYNDGDGNLRRGATDHTEIYVLENNDNEVVIA